MDYSSPYRPRQRPVPTILHQNLWYSARVNIFHACSYPMHQGNCIRRRTCLLRAIFTKNQRKTLTKTTQKLFSFLVYMWEQDHRTLPRSAPVSFTSTLFYHSTLRHTWLQSLELLKVDIDGAASHIDQTVLINSQSRPLLNVHHLRIGCQCSRRAEQSYKYDRSNEFIIFLVGKACTYHELPPAPITLIGLQLTWEERSSKKN